MVSHFQFARPAVVFSLFDQIVLTPPVEAVKRAMLPPVISVSSSTRKSVASVAFVALKTLRAVAAARDAAVAVDLVGDLRGEAGVVLFLLKVKMSLSSTDAEGGCEVR